jgi:hypothetical protein
LPLTGFSEEPGSFGSFTLELIKMDSRERSYTKMSTPVEISGDFGARPESEGQKRIAQRVSAGNG